MIESLKITSVHQGRMGRSLAGRQQVRLRDVCQITARQVDPRKPEYAHLPHISGENIETGTGRLMFVRTVAEDAIASGNYLFQQGDVLYSKLRPYLRKVAVVDSRGLCSADMYPITVDSSNLNPQYLLWLLLSEEFTKYAIEQSARSRMPKLNREQLLSWQFSLPPVPEQDRISVLLSEHLAIVDRARASSEAQAKVLHALPSAHYRAAFRGITPLAIGSDRDAAPTGWRWHRLTDLARLESGHTPSRRHPEWWGGDIPWVALPDIRALDGRIAFDTGEHTNPAGIANSSARVLPTGTVMLSRTASVGFVSIMGRPMATSQDFVNWVCGPDLEPVFLAHVLRASRTHIRELASGAIHKTVYMPTVQAFQVCVPARDQQERLAAQLDKQLSSVESARRALEDQGDLIKRLPVAMLRKVFTGGF